jgi:hypothetical protein
MKSIIFFLLLSIPCRNEAQNVKLFLDAIVKSESAILNKFLSDEVNCSLEGSAIIGKHNVIAKLTDFVSSAGIRSDKLIHEAVTKGKESYMGIGSLISDKSKYRVYLTFGAGDKKGLVQDIKIEKDIF